jgi:hypothetical protein
MKLQRFESTKSGGAPNGVHYVFWCPGCSCHHIFVTLRDERPVWTFNGDTEKPSFTPSLLYPSKTPRCHLFVTDGKIIYQADCGHSLAGQTVDLPDIPADQVW